MVAPFLRGYPPSEIPTQPNYDALTLGADLIGLIETLGEEPVGVAGHDFGALAVYGALAASPQSVGRAAVLALPHPAQFARVVQHPALIHHGFHIWFLAHRGIADVAAAYDDMALIDYLWRHWSGGREDASHIERVKRETLGKPGALTAALDYYRSLLGVDGESGLSDMVLHAFDSSILVIYGAEDPGPKLLAPGEEKLYTDGYKRIDVPDAGHFVHRDQPEFVTKLLLGWLAGESVQAAAA